MGNRPHPLATQGASVIWRIPASPLTGGVSKQPEPTRDSNQLDEADNVLLYIQRGLEKRHGTTYINSGETATGAINLTGSANTRWHVHSIDRQAPDQFMVFFDDQQTVQENRIQAFTIDGEKQAVNISASPVLAETGLDLSSGSVLDLTDDFIVVSPYFYAYAETGDAVVYADGGGGAPTGLVDTTTYYVIKTATENQIKLATSEANAIAGTAINITGLGTGSAHSLSSSIPKAMAYLRYGTKDAKRKYRTLTVGDATFIVNKEAPTFLTGEAPTYTNLFASDVLKFPNDSFDASGAEWDVGKHINLVSADVGYPVGIYEIIANPRDAGDQAGPWYSRVPSQEDGNEIEEGSFPVRLRYSPATGEFTLGTIEWEQRLSGDDVTNPGPEFIGHPVQDLAVFQDRLWLGAGPYLFGSQAGDLFNLWVDDWTNIADSDPIDFPLAGKDIHTVQFLQALDKTFVIFAEGGRQFELKSQNSFTPTDANLIPTTAYKSSPLAYPARIGQQLYFASDQGDYSAVWEYFYNFEGDSNIAIEASKHAERYLPEDLTRMVASENNGLLLCSEDLSNSIYCLFSYWNVGQKVQNAWCRWVFDPAFDILSYDIFDNTLYVVFTDGTRVWFESMPVATPNNESDSEGSLDFRLHMDRKLSLSGVYSGSTQSTTFTLPFLDAGMDTVVLGAGYTNKKGIKVQAVNDSSGSATALTIGGNYSASPCFVGKSYDMDVTLSKVYPKDSNGQVIFGAFQVLFLDIYMRNTTTADVLVTPPGRSTRTLRFVANRIGSAILGRTGLAESARKRVRVRGRGSDTEIRLFNDSPFQSEITHLEFTGDLQAGAYQPTARGG
jgi:hypothetical protein